MKLPEIHLWRDDTFRSAAENMALDEALFAWSAESATAMARFYHWDRTAVTVGYFHRGPSSGVVRRFTGGGLVEHGEDLTFVIALPAGCEAARVSAGERYRWIHEGLALGMKVAGQAVSLEMPGQATGTGPCFANPVPWDLIDPSSAEKIGGGAQRRSRGAVIHQGSVRLPERLRHPRSPWIGSFLETLADSVVPLAEVTCDALAAKAATLAVDRYASGSWNGGA